MKNHILVILLLSALFACQNNKLKNNEKALAQKILSEEEQIALKESIRLEKEKIGADSIAKLPKGFQFKEIRSVDVNHPPKIIDIANSLDTSKEMKLSDVASDIEYIKMQAIPDSTVARDLKLKYHIMDKYIVASNLYGIHLYSKKGAYIRSVVKNKLTGVEIELDKNIVSYYYSDYTHVGGSINVWSRGNNLFYNYQNSITGQNMIMELDCSNQQMALNLAFDPENPNAITGLGKVCVDLNHGINKPEKFLYPNGAFGSYIDDLQRDFSVFNPDKNTYITNLTDDKMLGILNTKGDTLASFRKLEQVKNYTKRSMRGTDFGTKYEKAGHFFFRTDFNDTIFQVIPPNIIRPVYVLNLAQYKLNKQTGVDPDASLKGKIIPMDWADAKDHIFLTFSIDNYDSPKNRSTHSVKIYHAVFSKNNDHLNIIKANPTDYRPHLLENDIDGGLAVWPLCYMIGKKGEVLVSLKGKELKDHIKSALYKNSSASIEKKERLKLLTNSLFDQDDVLMIVN
ncbi:hypothetical protein BZG02_12800 [Labilibaculum filiforme]|uniref:DUF4933 domain-containing protein n=1 Tax=Labilibaculum filiforme TaxID=1940526 RepID=A0A2N3HWY6_9BACT|nr:DUF4933 domain-containing protein [Labilibaculum filiforme]PKQ62590.1 hypothetical protein BZG02_12800 [Labilibaculum filiforme]